MLSTCTTCTASTSSSGETINVGKLRASAEVAFTKGEIEQALRIWQQVIARISFFFNLYNNDLFFDQVIDIEPQNEQNFFKRYRVYIRQQKLKEALADLNSALQINPKNENILVSRGKLHLKLGKCTEAAKDFELLNRFHMKYTHIFLHNSIGFCSWCIHTVHTYTGIQSTFNYHVQLLCS